MPIGIMREWIVSIACHRQVGIVVGNEKKRALVHRWKSCICSH